MNMRSPKAKPTIKRVAFEVPKAIEPDFQEIAKQIGTKRAGLAQLAVKFAVEGLRSGRLTRVNNELVETKQAA